MIDYLEYPNVVGFGRGKRSSSGKNMGEDATVVLVRDKLPEVQLSPSDILPKDVDVVQVVEIRAQNGTDIHRPAPGGVSIGHFAITAGTLGCRVFDPTMRRMILSNNHVLANTNDAKGGDAIYQPGPHDGGVAPAFARLDAFVPIDFGESGCIPLLNRVKNPGPNLVDAALALPVGGGISDDILEIGVPSGTRKAVLGLYVRKSGRTTGLTAGWVQVIDATVQVSYGSKTATFEQQIITSSMSEGGDSGSLLVDSDNVAVGLLFAGSPTITIHNDINNVLRLLRVTL